MLHKIKKIRKRSKLRRYTSSGFTLVELLVVIAIIGVLVALLLPAVQSAREAGRRSQCQNNLKQMGLAFHNFEGQYKFIPPAKISFKNGDPQQAYLTCASTFGITPYTDHGWMPLILPFVEQGSLQDRYFFSSDWDDVENRPARNTFLPIFVCPSSAGGMQRKVNSPTDGIAQDYAANQGVDLNLAATGLLDTNSGNLNLGPMRKNELVAFRDILDGLSNTIFIVETAGRPALYHTGARLIPGQLAPDSIWCDQDNSLDLDGADKTGISKPGPCPMNCTNDGEVYSFHPTGANVLIGDGSVRFVSDSIAIRVFARLMTRCAGEQTGIE